MSVVPILKQTDIFVDFSPTQLALIESICVEQSYGADDVIFEENTDGSELYVIVEGEVDIQVDPAMIGRSGAGRPQTIATLRRGQSFGEVALVDQGLRSARALATQPDTRVLVIPRSKLMLMCDSYPQMGYRLMRNLAADLAMKIRHTDLKVREYLTWIPGSDS
ncbi:MAG: cyclic nucleotide-binding domain-containing protein [Chloroflexota bacterium]